MRGARDIVVPGGGSGNGALSISAGTASGNLSSVVFSNANGVSFGLNGSTITASIAAVGGAQTGISGIIVSDATYTSGTVSFSNQANVTIGSSVNGATQYIRLSVAAQSNQSAIKGFGVSNTGATAGNTGISTGIDWVLAGSNSITLSQSTAGGGPNTVWIQHPAWITTAMASNRGSDFVAATAVFNGTNASGTIASNAISVSVAAQSNQTVGLYASSNTYLTSSGTVDARSLSFRGDKSITVGVSAGEVLFSVGAYLTTAMLSNAATISNIKVSAGTSSTNLSAITFSDSNGVSFGLNGSVITASVAAAGGAQTGISGIVVSDTTYTSGTVSFSNQNGVTIGSSVNGATQYIRLSVATNYQSQAAYLTTAALSGDTTKYVQNWKLTGNTAGTTSSAQGTDLWFSGGNSVTVSGNSNTIVISVGNYLTTAMASNRGSDFVAATAAFNGTNASGTIASNAISVSVLAQTNQTLGMYALGTTSGQSSSTTLDARTVSLSGFGPLSLGFSVGSVQISLAGALYIPLYAHLGGV